MAPELRKEMESHNYILYDYKGPHAMQTILL